MENLWKNRTPPKPLKFGEFDVISGGSGDAPVSATNTGVLRDQKIWDFQECCKYFGESVIALKDQLKERKEGDDLVWDKDDKAAMDFVTACSNVRGIIFSIPQKSRFETKSMAGNIIPAIATTNAITAGIVVLHAFKVLQGKFDKCQSVYMRLRPNARNQLFVPDRSLNPPNPKCYVCASKPEVVLKIATDLVTVKELRDDVLVKALNMVDPDVILDGKGLIVISSEEGETECNNDKLLKDLFIVDGCILKVDDFFQNYELSITIVHKAVERDSPRFEVIADMDCLKPVEEKVEEPAASSSENGNGSKAAAPEDSDDDLVCIDEEEMETEPVLPSSSAEKRKHTEEEDVSPNNKRARLAVPEEDLNDLDDDDIVCID